MTERSLTQHVEQRMQRLALEDGLFEIALGLWLALMGSAYFVLARIDLSPLLFIPGYLLTIALLPLLMGPGIRAVREALVYPRRGYARHRPASAPQRRRRALVNGALGGVIGVGAGLLAAGSAGAGAESFPWQQLVFGLAMALFYAAFALRLGLYRWLLIAGLSIAFTLAGAVFAADALAAIVGALALEGAALLIMGLAVMMVFLRRYPARSGEEEAQP